MQGVLLNTAAFFLLGTLTNLLAALLAVAGTVWYVFVYTIWLKRRSPQNIVIGGAAGSFPPLVGWAAATGGLDLTALALGAVIFLWTPPHFWALATMLEADYRKARVPMLPVVRGPERTARSMLLYLVATLGAAVAPGLWGSLGMIYLVPAAALGVWFVLLNVRHLLKPSIATARRIFTLSIWLLAILFIGAALDRVAFGFGLI